MYCIKCGTENPDTGKFCRSCGVPINGGVVVAPVVSPELQRLVDRKGKKISYESAMAKAFTGIAFIVIACFLYFTNAAGGHAWGFWMLIPGFASLGKGIAQYLQIKNSGGPNAISPMQNDVRGIPAAAPQNLAPAQQQWVSPDSTYKTGDLVPPSVTETTTRHLSMDTEGQTMTLPSDKK